MAKKKAAKEKAGVKKAAPKKSKAKSKAKSSADAQSGITEFLNDLWQAAVSLRGSIEPSDYKRYVLPIIFLRLKRLRKH